METKGREQSSNIIDRRPKTIEDIIDQESFPNKTQSSQFLIDTFKRARETGYSLPPEVFNAYQTDTYVSQPNGFDLETLEPNNYTKPFKVGRPPIGWARASRTNNTQIIPKANDNKFNPFGNN